MDIAVQPPSPNTASNLYHSRCGLESLWIISGEQSLQER